MNQHKFYSTGHDYIDKIFRYYHFLIFVTVTYASIIQYIAGNHNTLFLGLSAFYGLWNLFFGIISISGKMPKVYDKLAYQAFRLLFNISICSALLYLGSGAFEYYILFFPWLIALNLYVLEKRNDKLYSALIASIFAAIYFRIQSSKISKELLHISSTVTKALLLMFASFISYWFWKNRKSHLEYVESIKHLHQVGHTLTAAKTSKEVLEEIGNSALKALGADIVTIIQYDSKKDEFPLPPLIYGELVDPSYKRSLIGENDVAYVIVKKRESMFVSDVQADSVFARKGEFPYEERSSQPFVFREKIISTAAMHLEVRNETVGVMFINYRSPHAFPEKEKQVLSIYADYAAIAIKTVREKEVLQRATLSATRILYDRLSQLPLGEREDAAIRLVLNESLDLLEERLAYFSSYDANTDRLKIVFASQEYKTQIGFEYSAERGLTGKAVREREVQVMNRRQEQPEYVRFSEIDDKQFRTDADANIKSAIAVPLVIGDNVRGVYMIESSHESNFSEMDVQIVQSFVAQAAIAIANIRLLNEITHNESFLQKLREIDNQILDTDFDLPNTLHTILQNALKLVHAQKGEIILRLNDANKVKVVESTNRDKIGTILDIHDSITGVAFLQKRMIYVPDINKLDQEQRTKYKPLLGPGLNCELVVPLITKDDMIGAFNLESSQIDAFKEKQREALEMLAGQAAIAINSTRLFAENKRRSEQLAALREIDEAILNSNLALSDTLTVILKRAINLINKSYGNIILLEEDKKQLVINKCTDPEDEGRRLDIDKSISGLAVKQGETIYEPNLDEQPLYLPPASGRSKSELAIPLKVNGDTIGVINVESAEYDDFSQDEIQLLKNLSGAAAIAIVNAQRYQELERAKKKLERSIDIEILAGSTQMIQVFDHNISNQVGMIRLKVNDLLDKSDTFDQKTIAALKTIQSCAERVLQFPIEENKKMSSLLESKKERIELSSVEKDVSENEELTQNKSIAIKFTGLDKLPPIEANYNHLREGVFFELIRNAMKAMPNGGTITITGRLAVDTKVADKHVEIIFTDTGCGIPQDELPEIFKPSYSKWKDGKGSGKGLYHLKAIVNLHRGEVSVSSEVGKGTSFTIKLPLAKAQAFLARPPA